MTCHIFLKDIRPQSMFFLRTSSVTFFKDFASVKFFSRALPTALFESYIKIEIFNTIARDNDSCEHFKAILLKLDGDLMSNENKNSAPCYVYTLIFSTS